jgi:uncharacterized protein YrrD
MAFKSLEGVTDVKVEAGENPGTQLVMVKTDGSAELSKRDAIKSLGDMASKYVVKDWKLQGAESSAEPEPAPAMKSNLLAESQDWTNKDGQTITAAVQKVEAGQVYFIMEKGKVVAYPVSKLSDETIAKLKELMQ